MNCHTAREHLIDLIYGELTDGDRRALEGHLATCRDCRDELDRLRLARSALAESLADEPAAEFRLPPAAAPPLRRLRTLGPAAAAAAAVVLGVWLLHDATTPTASAQAGPAEIRRLAVSVTILSRPEGWGRFLYDEQAAQVPAVNVAMSQTLVQVQTERPVWGWRQPVWPGMALVRDRRIVRRLPRGPTRIRFADVPSGILPDTVRLRSLDAPGGLAVLEQNYQYDLASAAAVLARHVDEPLTAVFKDGRAVAGELLSFDAAALVVRPPGAGPRTLARQDLRQITFAALPEGLLSRPTLVWELDNRAAARQRFEVAYLTHGLNWRADYVLKLHPARVPPAGGQIANPTDTADLVGYATVTNHSGVTYEGAQLKLMAGDVNLIKPPTRLHTWHFESFSLYGAMGGARPVMTEKSFFEYHLYTVTRPTTIRHAETKQLEMVSGRGLKLSRGYVYDRRVNRTAARVVSELKNTKANGLGKPLPKGVVRLYAPDPEGLQTFVAKTTIDHTPKGEKLRLPWGYAFDIACSARRMHYERSGADRREVWRYDIRNHKDHDVNVTVMAAVPKSTRRAACEGFRWHVREVGKVEIDVPVRANRAAAVTFEFRWNPESGGGLTSPHDKEK